MNDKTNKPQRKSMLGINFNLDLDKQKPLTIIVVLFVVGIFWILVTSLSGSKGNTTQKTEGDNSPATEMRMEESPGAEQNNQTFNITGGDFNYYEAPEINNIEGDYIYAEGDINIENYNESSNRENQ